MLIKLFFYVVLVLPLFAQASLIKLSEIGEPVSHNSNQFYCVLDTDSELVWEVKHTQAGLQNKDNTYTWFDGETGVKDGQYSRGCNWNQSCNTQAFITHLNQTNICNIDTWRLPTEAELQTLIVYGDNDTLIDGKFFPHTVPASYWSSDELDTHVAIDVPFFYGGVKSSDKFFDAHIRAVSHAD